MVLCCGVGWGRDRWHGFQLWTLMSERGLPVFNRLAEEWLKT